MTSTSPAPEPGATSTGGARTRSVLWTGQLTALSSIAHGGEHRGTVTTIRRERILRHGEPSYVPILSGNGIRGRLRRTAEELYRETVGYEGQIDAGAAHVLRSGGSLVKRASTTALTGSRLRTARELVPPLAIFGGVVGRSVEGALQVGKAVPHLAETAHLTGQPGPSMFTLLQLETYTRAPRAGAPALEALDTTSMPMTTTGDVDRDALAELNATDPRDDLDGQMVFRLETLPAGTVMSTWLRLAHVSDLHLAFFVDVLAAFTAHARIGGRAAMGHGLVDVDLVPDIDLTGLPDWRAPLRERRAEVMAALALLG